VGFEEPSLSEVVPPDSEPDPDAESDPDPDPELSAGAADPSEPAALVEAPERLSVL
jgi:hypothetical protein